MEHGPSHVGLIPDGLRRWAAAHHITLADAYLRGAHQVIDILQTLRRHGVRTVTVYNLSRANLGRTDEELDAVYQASLQFLTALVPAAFDATACGFRLFGDRKALPDNYIAAAHDLEVTMTGAEFRINLLAAYDAYDELRDAQQRAEQSGGDIASAFEIGDVDLVIRTTAEPLLSGFLPLQSQYAQLYFLTTPLNDLTIDHIGELIARYRGIPQLRGR